MAIPRWIPVAFGDVFPHGAFVLGVEPANDFEKSKAGVADAQERDKETGELLWAVRVMDADPNARAGSAEVKVKIPGPVQPVPPEPLAGTALRPVEFEGLTVMPWVNRFGATPKQGLALRAKGMRPVRTGSGRAAA
ncbi:MULTISPECIES: plasmid replication, integration and excision activator [unclassified Frankia]|uniref:plasmid replication, integration and excision activator n=1 Tax=unclassified Frankia TaxID=2632575 RepID=UPI002AD56194|nr:MULTISPECIES: plasmid replication, integration and excision activator [unclassified Frankia]